MILNNINEPSASFPNSIIALFITLHTIFGFNFGFIQYFDKSVRVLIKLLSIVAFIAWVCLQWYTLVTNKYLTFNLSNLIWSGVNLTEYITFCLILNFSNVKFYNFVLNINESLEIVPELTVESLGIKSSAYVFFALFVRYSWFIIICLVSGASWCDTVDVFKYFVDLTGITIDSISMLLILINYYIYCYLKKLDRIASQTESDVDILVQYFLNLEDSYDYIMPLYDRLIATMVMFEVPRMMSTVWAVLHFIKYGSDWFAYVSLTVETAHMTARLVLPCIMTEIIKSKVEAVRLTLNQRALRETETKMTEIQDLLRYMSVYRLHHLAWRVIPLDTDLPLFVLSTCVTYLIVLVQFTHLY